MFGADVNRHQHIQRVRHYLNFVLLTCPHPPAQSVNILSFPTLPSPSLFLTSCSFVPHLRGRIGLWPSCLFREKNQIHSLQLYKKSKKRESCDCLVLMCKRKKNLKNTAGVTLRGLQKQGMGAPACANTVFYTSRLTKKGPNPRLSYRHQNKHSHALQSGLHQCMHLLECHCVFSMLLSPQLLLLGRAVKEKTHLFFPSKEGNMGP